MALNLNTTRLTGLASNMDTDTIIQNMMKIEQYKMNKDLRARTTMEWRQEALKTLKTDLQDFRNNYFSALSKNNIKNTNSFFMFDVTMANNDKNAVTLRATSTAKAGSVVISEVNQLASGATIAGKHQMADVYETDEDGNIVYNGNGDPVVAYQARQGVSKVPGAHLGVNTNLASLDLKNPIKFDENGEVRMTINGKEFTFSGSDTVQGMMDKINKSDAGVTMSYSEITDTFSIVSNGTGFNSYLSLGASDSNLVGINGGGAFGLDAGSCNGTNAQVIINGVRVVKDSNTFTLDGISYTLNAVTGENADIRATISQDFEGPVEKIKEFVNGYNALVEKLTGMLGEKKTNKEKGYTPLTDEEKSTMTEKQIEDWEKIAKKGLMYNDRDIQSMLDEIRGAFYTKIEAAGLTPAEIGLQTGHWSKKGQLELDENLLRAAIQEDTDKVMKVFMGGEDTPGLIDNIEKAMDKYMGIGGTQQRTLESIDRNLLELDKKIYNMEQKMLKKEERLYLQFAAMEKAMAELQNQSNSLVNMLSQNS